ncbi:glutathione S-transferase family protein [Oceaniradius stylonematis]|uniref:glutathione S-transferase family protein n=1 Tax=Oceaniradius stylonematis TaxID=2184161 RepID=UPI003C7DDC57
MPTLLYSPASPYSAKVRMAARYLEITLKLDIALTPKIIATGEAPPELTGANPLGKIPTLVLDDGAAIFDSRAIMGELDRMSGNKLYPRPKDKRRKADILEAASDGLCDVLLAQVYEHRMRPEEKVHTPWLDYQARKAERTFDWLEMEVPALRGRLHGGHFALAAALGYADLRFPELNWRRGRPRLRRFIARFAEAFPDYEVFKPS